MTFGCSLSCAAVGEDVSWCGVYDLGRERVDKSKRSQEIEKQEEDEDAGEPYGRRPKVKSHRLHASTSEV